MPKIAREAGSSTQLGRATYLSVLREITDEEDRREMLMQAQILLTGFIFGLQPLPKDRGNRGTIGFHFRDGIGFDA